MLYTLRGDEIFYEKLFMCVLFQTYLAQAPYDRNIVRQSRLKINGWCMSLVSTRVLIITSSIDSGVFVCARGHGS